MNISNEKIKSYLDDFRILYRQKNFSQNNGGMRFPQLFGTYCILKETNPSLVIESGIWKGLGTWLIEHTLPDSKIISFDIDLSLREYISEEVTYVENDINSIDWDKFFDTYQDQSPDNTLLFLDDHIDINKRFELLKNTRFKYIIDEDNYPTEQGCRISPKTILEGEECIIVDDNGNKITQKIDASIKDEYNYLIKSYWEFPPIHLPANTRWGDEFSKYNTKKPIFDSITEEIKEFGNYDNYTWLCCLETNPK
jgi:hypothetical protein